MSDQSKLKTRIVIVGGGFGGLYTAAALDKLTREDPTIEITLVSRENFLLVTPLLFEAGSGVLDPRHVVSPCRALLKKVRFCEANVTEVDIANRVVKAAHRSGIRSYEFPYDQLVIAVGGDYQPFHHPRIRSCDGIQNGCRRRSVAQPRAGHV